MRRYLIVDDNVAFAENLAEILRDDGAEAVVAPSGAKALELARNDRFDALVTDMRMPVMNGAQLVHAIRRQDPGLPAIVVTAYTGETDLTDARNEGLLAVLPKPAPIDRLLELLEKARRNGLVAVIEDDLALADNMTELLQERGFSAVTAHSVPQTVMLCGAKPFAAVVDLRMPGGPDGAALRTFSECCPLVPTLVVSAFANEVKGVKEPAAFFHKPFAPDELLGALERLYGARESVA
jgi:two-component system, response regulator PdtaR